MKRYKVKITCPGFDKDDILEIRQLNTVTSKEGNEYTPEWYPEIFEEIKEPLFVTEDGKELYSLSDEIFPVDKKHYCLHKGNLLKHYFTENYNDRFVYLSSKEAAEKWIDENKPVFSKNNIKKAILKYTSFDDYSRLGIIKELGL